MLALDVSDFQPVRSYAVRVTALSPSVSALSRWMFLIVTDTALRTTALDSSVAACPYFLRVRVLPSSEISKARSSISDVPESIVTVVAFVAMFVVLSVLLSPTFLKVAPVSTNWWYPEPNCSEAGKLKVMSTIESLV